MHYSNRYIDNDDDNGSDDDNFSDYEDLSEQNEIEEPSRSCIENPRPSSHFGQVYTRSAKIFNPNNYKSKLSASTDLFSLSEDIFVILCEYLSFNDQLSLFLTSNRIINIVKNCKAILRNFVLEVNKDSLEKLTKHHELLVIPFMNIEIDLNSNIKLKEITKFIQNFKSSVVNLTIKNARFYNFREYFQIINSIPNVQSLSLEKCEIEKLSNEILPKLPTLKAISLTKCDDNIYKTLVNQKTIEMTTIKNNDWSWNGFPHEIFNKIAKKSKNHIKAMIFVGAGTGSFFDCEEFPFKISKLDTTMITFHWYVGIKSERVSFLRSQLGVLKDLTIHQWPNDFDGGRVLKFIFNHMNLQNFYYKKTALILDGNKQEVKRIEVTEIQIQSLFELVRQFPSITSICLNLSASDIASDQIEKVINPPTDLFKNILEFEIVDSSRYRGLFGVFLGLLKNLINVRKLSFKTQDRNINVILEECLPYMNQLNEIYLTSTANRSRERFLTIQRFAPCLIKISVAPQHLEEAKLIFGTSVHVCVIENDV